MGNWQFQGLQSCFSSDGQPVLLVSGADVQKLSPQPGLAGTPVLLGHPVGHVEATAGLRERGTAGHGYRS